MIKFHFFLLLFIFIKLTLFKYKFLEYSKEYNIFVIYKQSLNKKEIMKNRRKKDIKERLVENFNKLNNTNIQLNESGYPRIANIMRGIVPSVKTVGFITGENPAAKPSSAEYNKSANAKVEKSLKDANYGYVKVKGEYAGSENSFFVPNIAKDELLKMGRKFGQESVIYGEKVEDGSYDGMRFQLIYTDDRYGTVVGERYVFINRNDEEDYYTEVKGRKFQIPIYDKEFENVKFKKGSGVYKKKKIGENIKQDLIEEIEMLNNRNFEVNRTGKSKWMSRGHMNLLIDKLYDL